VRSDAYELAGDWTVRLAPGREEAPIVELSDEFKLLADFEERFAHGPPSLREAERLDVEGDVRFGRNVVVRGRARVEGPAEIPDGAVLEG
jgi:UTP--glucose-1-phosphate uridylyltransferase